MGAACNTATDSRAQLKLPGKLSIQTINALSGNPHIYESHKRQINAYNQLVSALGPGTPVSGQNLSSVGLGTSPTLAVTGTLNRGRMAITVGSSSSAGATVTLGFPAGTWSDTPFAQVTQNGGTGVSLFSWTESPTQLVITIATPIDGETYVFQYAIRD